MAQRPVVPQFGNWDSEDNVPYTVYFEKARKGKNGGKMINPNDPMQNPGMFPPAQTTPCTVRNVSKEPIGRKAVRPKTTDIQSNSENDDRIMKFTEGPLRNDNVSRGTDSTNQNRRGNGWASGQPRRQNAESEHGVDQSLLHQQNQAKVIGKGSSSSTWESKHYSDSSHGTTGRSRMKPISTGVESPDKDGAVPRFGGWDEKNLSSADNYTEKFNKVRQEKKSSSTMVSNKSTGPTPTGQAYANRRKQIDYNKKKSSWGSCFGKSGART